MSKFSTKILKFEIKGNPNLGNHKSKSSHFSTKYFIQNVPVQNMSRVKYV